MLRKSLHTNVSLSPLSLKISARPSRSITLAMKKSAQLLPISLSLPSTICEGVCDGSPVLPWSIFDSAEKQVA